MLRYSLYEKARYYPEIVFSLGNRLECPFCGWHFRRFRPAGFHHPVIIEKRVRNKIGVSTFGFFDSRNIVSPGDHSTLNKRLMLCMLGTPLLFYTSLT